MSCIRLNFPKKSDLAQFRKNVSQISSSNLSNLGIQAIFSNEL